jgi:hypothetical protein
MKNEPSAATSGLKATGVIVLLASLLLLLPAASAGSWAMSVTVVPSQSMGSIGDDVEFTYTLINIGDQPLYNVAVDGLGDEDPVTIDVLEPAAEETVVGYYTVAAEDITDWGQYEYAINDAWATGENSRGRLAVISYAGVGILIIE